MLGFVTEGAIRFFGLEVLVLDAADAGAVAFEAAAAFARGACACVAAGGACACTAAVMGADAYAPLDTWGEGACACTAAGGACACAIVVDVAFITATDLVALVGVVASTGAGLVTGAVAGAGTCTTAALGAFVTGARTFAAAVFPAGI